MNEYLTREIWKMRKNIKTAPGTPVVSLVRVENKTYQLLFISCGCENACTFCNYGFDYNLTLEMVKPELEKIRLEDFDIVELELEANGSFLSEREIPYDLFLEILHFVSNRNIPIITMETHYNTITEKKIQDIRRILGEEQIQDCLNSLKFIYEKMPKGTQAVLFPINIKKNTMLKHWQDIGVYDQISSWEFVELLHRIPEEYLDKFTIAWWGNRENTFTKGIIQFPKTCDKCRERLMKFYADFYCNWNPSYRKKILDEIWATRCECDQK